MRFLRNMAAICLILQPAMTLIAFGEEESLSSVRVLAQDECKDWGTLSLQQRSSQEILDDGQRKRRENISVFLLGATGEPASFQISSRSWVPQGIGSVGFQPQGAVSCDSRSLDIFVLLVEGGPLRYRGEMIRLTMNTSRSSLRNRSVKDLEFSESRLGFFDYRPHYLAAGPVVVSSVQLGRKMLVHLEADGKGAYTGVLFLLDFDTGSAQEVKVLQAEGEDSPIHSFLDPGSVDPTLPVPWDLEADTGSRTEPETLPSSVQEPLIEN